MKKYLRITLLTVIVISTIFLVECAVNPVTGKKEIMLVSEKMEIGMGRDIDRGIRMEYGLYHSPQLNAYVERIGRAMVPHTHRPHLQYHFAILDTPVENAFAAPGGFIYVTRGLLALMNSEAELASVLGHELGHVSARHSARQMTRSILFTVGIALASGLSKDFRKIAPISFVAGQLLFLKYGRSAEHQSDSLGIGYAIKAGYASERMIDFFSSLQNITRVRGRSRVPNFLSTHPVTAKRIQRVKEQLQAEEYSRKGGMPRLTVARDNYLRKIDGLVYGKNPRQGYVERGTFYHPDMSFSFQVPYRWKLSNTARQVTIVPENEKAIIILKAENTNESVDSYAKKMMAKVTDPQVLDEGFRRINGLNAFHSLLTMKPGKDESEEEKQKDELNVRISCIRKGGTVFTFFSAASLSDYYSYENAIEGTVNSFGRLVNNRQLNRRPKRLFIRKVRRSQTLRKFLQRRNIPKTLWKKIALINSMEPASQLSANQLIKLVK